MTGGIDYNKITINGGTLSVTGNISMTGTATKSLIVFNGSGTINLGGNISGGGLTAGIGTVNYNGVNQNIGAYTYRNLTLSGSGTKTMQSATTVTGNMTIDSGATLDEAGITITLGTNSILTVNGTLDFSDSGGLIRTGNDLNATLTMGLNGLIKTKDDAGLGPVANNTNNPSLQTQGTGTWTTTSLNSNGTVEYNRTSAQTVIARTYNNLTLSGSGTKTTTGVTVNGILSMEGTATANAAPTYTDGTSSLVYNGSAQQTAGAEWLATMTRPVTITNVLGVNTNGSKVITSPAILTVNGILIPGAAHIISGSGTLTGSGTVKATRTTATADFNTQYTIPKTLTNLTVDYSGAGDQLINPLTYNNLTISGSGTKTIASTSAVTVNGLLTVNNGSTLTIASTGESATGSLKLSSAPTVNGVVKAERFLSSGTWHLISSPVSGQGLATFGAANCAVNITPTPNDYDLASYQESNDTWSYVQVGGSGSFGPANGYSMSGKGTSVTFTGTGINTGNPSIGITCGTTTNGWNCIGNPYTSAIDAAAFLAANKDGIENSFEWIYLWDPSGTGDYTQTTAGSIALGQGFFVNSVLGGASMSFTTAMQTTGGTFKSAEIPLPTIKLIAKSGSLSNETTVNFNSSMTRGLDPGHDGGKLKGNPDIALYTRLLEDNGIDFAIQALPELSTETIRIPVGIDFVPGGEMSFTVETSDLPIEAQVYLEDIQTKSTTLLSADNAKYTVKLNANTQGTGRFNLLVTKNATGINKAITNSAFRVYTTGNLINISGQVSNDTEFGLYSIEGKQFANLRAKNLNQNTIDASAFPSGIYLLNIRQQGRQTTQKLVLTK